MNEIPAFIQGVFPFKGAGLDTPVPFRPAVAYMVPADKRSQTVYFRAGNAAAELISLLLTKNGRPMRLFPVGAKAALHVALAVVEDLSPSTRIEVLIAAPKDLESFVVLDIGFLEIL